jgi:hypothetical protein
MATLPFLEPLVTKENRELKKLLIRGQPKGESIMASLSEILDDAHDGEAMSALGREFGLMPAQTQAVVPISTGLKQSTATVDGLSNLLGMMGQQQDASPAPADHGSEGQGVEHEAASKQPAED